jgi:hypothetical protein
MPPDSRKRLAILRAKRLREAMDVLQELGFAPRQRNEGAGYVLLSLLDLPADAPWAAAQSPLRGITPMITFIRETYGVSYAPNTRETIRDEAVKYFVEAGMVLRNPDNPERPTNSGRTVYQIEPSALSLMRTIGTLAWSSELNNYLAVRDDIRQETRRRRTLARIPVKLPSGNAVTLSPGGQNPLIKRVIEEFCPRFLPGGTVAYIGDTEDKFLHLDVAYLGALGVAIAAAAKMPDIIVHDSRRNWLVLIEAVSTAGPVDEKRRNELRELFEGCRAGLVYITAFESRAIMQSFLPQISWETEVWIAENPDHLIHFNGERFLGPYPGGVGAEP